MPTTRQGQIAPEVVYYVACSLDGYIAGPDGSVEWLTPFQAGGEDYGYREFYSSVEGLLMAALRLVEAKSYPSGIVQLNYEPE